MLPDRTASNLQPPNLGSRKRATTITMSQMRMILTTQPNALFISA